MYRNQETISNEFPTNKIHVLNINYRECKYGKTLFVGFNQSCSNGAESLVQALLCSVSIGYGNILVRGDESRFSKTS